MLEGTEGDAGSGKGSDGAREKPDSDAVARHAECHERFQC